MNYKYRMHDPRIGRFFATDPLEATFPHNSPYAFSENSTIAFVELEGLEKVKFQVVYITKTESKTIDFTTLTDKQIEAKLVETYEYHQGHVTLESVKAASKEDFWIVTNLTINGNRSTGTRIKGYSSEKAHAQGGKPFSTELKQDWSQSFYAKDDQLEGGRGVYAGMKLSLATLGVILSGGTLLAAEGLTIGSVYAGVSFAFSVDDLFEGANGETFLSTIAYEIGGDLGKDLLDGAKFAFSIRDATRGLINVTVKGIEGTYEGVYDVVNDIYTIEGTVKKTADKMNQKNK